MTEDHLQWIAIIGIFVWLTMISLWIGETTELLKTWWGDFLSDMVSKEYKERLKSVRGWAFSSKLERMHGPKNPYTPRRMMFPPKKRNGED